MDIKIRKIALLPELKDAMELQKAVWRLPDYADCIPEHMITAVIHAGGIALGAYSGEKMAGFLMALPAVDDSGSLYHYSHILGVLPEYAGNNIGFGLKKRHIEIAAESGINRVCWTYDPLLGQNANLNVGKLGATVRKYYLNYYGEELGGSELTAGMPSDRFWAEADTEKYVDDSKPSATEDLNISAVNRVSVMDNGIQTMTGFDLDLEKDVIFVEIPADFQALFDCDKKSATEWRLKTRELFTALFEKGYAVTGFLRKPEGSIVRNFYKLTLDKRYGV